MPHKRFVHAIRCAMSRLLPRRLHTSGLESRTRVDELSRAQRERLRQNLRAMLRPESA